MPPAAPSLSAAPPSLLPQPVELALPYHWKVAPVPANERGIARYEIFEQKAPYTGAQLPENNIFWTRPLENRDWHQNDEQPERQRLR